MTTKQIQYLLAYLGYYASEVDGIWGSQSAAAATRFQQDYGGLTVDGKVGEETQRALKQAVADGMPEKQQEDSFWDHIRYWTREEFRCHCGGNRRYRQIFIHVPFLPEIKIQNVSRETFSRKTKIARI